MTKFQKIMGLLAVVFFVWAWLARSLALGLIGCCYVALMSQKGFH